MQMKDFSRKSHTRDTSPDQSVIQGMISFVSDHASASKFDPGTSTRLSLCLKQVKAGLCSLKEVVNAFPTLPWKLVLEEQGLGKRPKEEDCVLVVDTLSESSDDLDQIVAETDSPASVLNDAQVQKCVGTFAGRAKAAISKESLSVLEKVAKAYMNRACEQITKAAAARVGGLAENCGSHVVTSWPRGELNVVEEKERVELLKAAANKSPKAAKPSEVKTAIKRAMGRPTRSEAETIPYIPVVQETANSLALTLPDVRNVLESDCMWRKSSLLMRVCTLRIEGRCN